jgi:hypothetical protein
MRAKKKEPPQTAPSTTSMTHSPAVIGLAAPGAATLAAVMRISSASSWPDA